MKAEIVPQAPRTRCYVCGQPKVAMICHHCGRAICDSHGPTPIPEGRTVENPEFAHLALGYGTIEETGIHCKDCVHYVRSFKWLIFAGAIVAAVGLVLLLIGLSGAVTIASAESRSSLRAVGYLCGGGGLFSLLTLPVGIGMLALGIYLQRNRYHQSVLDSRPPIPVIGKMESVSVTESITGQITLDAEGTYHSRADKCEGKLTLAFRFAPRDWERVEAYLKKYQLPLSDDLPFQAGFVVLEGAANLVFDDPSGFMPGRVNTIALEGTIGEQPFLRGAGERGNRWVIRRTYTTLSAEGEDVWLPVQIVPTLVQEGARRAIELVVQLTPETSGPWVLTELARVEEFMVCAPQSLGKVEIIEPAALVGAAVEVGEGEEATYTQAITWKGVSLAPGERRAQRKSFYVRFENTIEPTTVLKGRLRVRFDGALSGLDGVALFYPLGNERRGVGVQRHTYVDVDFNLDLGGLRFQEIALVEERIVREGVVPDHRMVTALTDALSAEEFYVKRVIENPPRTSKAGAHITNRYWDIAGRFYDGVYPIDFHSVLTGEEVYGGAARPHAGKTQVDVTVQGMVTDEEMRDQVEYLRDRLVVLINGTLDELPQTLAEMPLTTEESLDVVEEEEETLAMPVTPMQSIVTDRAAVLRARLDKLDDALLEGRISEARYEEMQARIEQELAELASED
jgi:hypothetical protein